MADPRFGPNMFIPTGNIPQRMRAALGYVVIHFSLLEWKIEQTIWLLRKNPRKVGRQYTRRKQFNKRIDALEKEVTKHFQDTTTKGAIFYERAITLAKALALWRNYIVHGMWTKGTVRGKKRKYFVLSYFDHEDGAAQELNETSLRMLNNNLVTLINLLDSGGPEFLGKPLP